MDKLIVIGGGPAGVTAALRARELGAAVTLIEGGALGGVCTNDGCVPTRVLARAARLARTAYAVREDVGRGQVRRTEVDPHHQDIGKTDGLGAVASRAAAHVQNPRAGPDGQLVEVNGDHRLACFKSDMER